jgi:hypothetical protein
VQLTRPWAHGASTRVQLPEVLFSACAYSPRDPVAKTRLFGASMRTRRMIWLSSSTPPTFEEGVKLFLSGPARR